MFHSLFVASFVFTAVAPRFYSLAVLKIVEPVAFILSTVDMNVDSVSIRFIVFPKTFVDITVSMPELAFAIGFVEAPLSFIFSAIWPDLGSGPVTCSVFQVTFIHCAIFKH